MSDAANINGNDGRRTASSDRIAAGLAKRYAAEGRFRMYGIAAVVFALFCVGVLFTTIISSGWPAFMQTMARLEVTLYPQDIDPEGTRDLQTLSNANYRKLIRQATLDLLPDVTSRSDKRRVHEMISPGAAFSLRELVMDDPSLVGKRVSVLFPMSDDIDQFNKGVIKAETPESGRRVSDKQIAWFQRLKDRGLVETVFNTSMFTEGDSREPELAGI